MIDVVLPKNLYNVLFGANEHANEILAMLDLKPEDCGRFRDAYLNADGTKIYIYTRNGGKSRKYLTEQNSLLSRHVFFKKSRIDIDQYLIFTFYVPPKHRARAKELATGCEPKKVSQKFDEFNSEMKRKSRDEVINDPRYSQLTKAMEQLTDKQALCIMDEDLPEPLKDEMRQKAMSMEQKFNG